MTEYTCLKCGKESCTKIICECCRINLTKYEVQKYDKMYQIIVIELGGNECVDCGHSAETESGELAADHVETKGASPHLRYDTANGLCRCAPCHNKRHAGTIPIIPPPTMGKKKKSKKTPICPEAGCIFTSYYNGKCVKHSGRKRGEKAS